MDRNPGAVLFFSLDFVNTVRAPNLSYLAGLGHTDAPRTCRITEQSPKDSVALERKLSHRFHIYRHATVLVVQPHKRSSLIITIAGVFLFILQKIKVTCACQRRGDLHEILQMPRVRRTHCSTRIKGDWREEAEPRSPPRFGLPHPPATTNPTPDKCTPATQPRMSPS